MPKTCVNRHMGSIWPENLIELNICKFEAFGVKLTLQSKWKLCTVGFMQWSLEWVVILTWGLQQRCLESKNWQFIFLHLMTFFVTFTFDLEKRQQLSDFLGVAEYVWTKNIPKSYKRTSSMVICLSIEYNGWCSGRSPSGCRISKAFYCYFNFILLSLSLKWYADMMSIDWNISRKPTEQSIHFDCSCHGLYLENLVL